MSTPPPVTGLLESVLYVDDLERSVSFYRDVIGLDLLFRDERMAALDVVEGQLLLLFRRGASTQPIEAPGGTIPPHDGRGQTHLAFSVSQAALEEWREYLDAKGLDVEGEVRWSRGGISYYFRDPDGHLIEVASPGIWATY